MLPWWHVAWPATRASPQRAWKVASKHPAHPVSLCCLLRAVSPQSARGWQGSLLSGMPPKLTSSSSSSNEQKGTKSSGNSGSSNEQKGTKVFGFAKEGMWCLGHFGGQEEKLQRGVTYVSSDERNGKYKKTAKPMAARKKVQTMQDLSKKVQTMQDLSNNAFDALNEFACHFALAIASTARLVQ